MIPGGLSPAGSVMLGMGAPGTQPNAPGPPLYGPGDPRSVYLAQALQQMQQQPQQSPVQTGSDLLAEALMNYRPHNLPVASSQAFSLGDLTPMDTSVGPLQAGFMLPPGAFGG